MARLIELDGGVVGQAALIFGALTAFAFAASAIVNWAGPDRDYPFAPLHYADTTEHIRLIAQPRELVSSNLGQFTLRSSGAMEVTVSPAESPR